MFFILDEWIIHDLANENDRDRQKESFQFLEKISEKCDKIILIENSKFIKKFWDFAKHASKNIELKGKAKFFKNIFIWNSQKSEFIDLKTNQSKKYSQILKKINPDDHYLVLAYEYLEEKGESPIIITTDQKLKQILEDARISIELREKFFEKYN